MVNFNEFYIDSTAIMIVAPFDTLDEKYPFGLSIELNTGAKYSVKYSNRTARENAKHTLISAIERDRRDYMESIFCKLSAFSHIIDRMEKRQLKIQKLLKEVLKWDDKSDG